MSVLIRRADGQARGVAELRDQSGDLMAGFDADFLPFGKATRLARLVAPDVKVNSSTNAAYNADLINGILNSLPPGSTIVLPNDTVYTHQINITPANSNVTIEGGADTLLINPGGGIAGPRVVLGQQTSFGYIADITGYGMGRTTFVVKDDAEHYADHYRVGDAIWVFPPFFRQSVANARLCQLLVITSVTLDTPGTSVTVGVSAAVSTTMATPVLAATVDGMGHVTGISVTEEIGAGCYRTGDLTTAPTVAISGGTGAAATVNLKAGVHHINITDGGHGYHEGLTTVAITAVGGVGSGATGVPVIEAGVITGVVITNFGSAYEQSPTVMFSDSHISPGTGAAGTATIGPSLIDSFNITAGGSGYTSATATLDPPPYAAKWALNGSALLDADKTAKSVRLAVSSRRSLFLKDSLAYLATGAAFNELGGRYFRVSDTNSSGDVFFYETIRDEDYIDGQTCLIPGPFIENLTIRNLNVGGLVEGEANVGAIFVEGGDNVTIENVQMVNGSDDDDLVPDLINFVGSQDIRLANCRSGIGLSTSNRASIVDCFVPNYLTHSFVRDVVFSRCRLQGSIVPATSSVRFRFEDCEFDQAGDGSLSATDTEDLAFLNCRIISTGFGWTMEGPRVRIEGTQILSGPLELRSGCSDAVIENFGLRGTASLTIQAGSTGRYANISSQPAIDGWSMYPAASILSRAMPANSTHWLELGNIAGTLSNIWCRLAMSTDAWGTVAKLYLFTMCDNDTTFPLNTWFTVQPISDSGPGIYIAGQNFAVEARRGSSDPDDRKLYLRVWRTLSDAGGVTGRFQLETNGTFTPTDDTGTDLSTPDPWPDQTVMAMARFPKLSADPSTPSASTCLLYLAHNGGTSKDELRAELSNGKVAVVAQS